LYSGRGKSDYNYEEKYFVITQKNNYRIKHLARKYGWKLLSEIDDTLIFQKIFMVLKINFSKTGIEIETWLEHPKKGTTQLSRSGSFSINLIEKIFRNPRIHTPENIKTEYKK